MEFVGWKGGTRFRTSNWDGWVAVLGAHVFAGYWMGGRVWVGVRVGWLARGSELGDRGLARGSELGPSVGWMVRVGWRDGWHADLSREPVPPGSAQQLCVELGRSVEARRDTNHFDVI